MGLGKGEVAYYEEQAAGIVGLRCDNPPLCAANRICLCCGRADHDQSHLGPPGTTVTVNGSGWQDHASRGWDVPIQINGVTLTTAHPDANGNFSVKITIPDSSAPGSRVRIDALLGNGGSASAWFDVTQPASGSPGGSPGSGGGTAPGTGNGIDLEVTKIKPLGKHICAGSKTTFQASIRNNGSMKSGFFHIRWIADNTKKFDGGHNSILAKATDTLDHKWKKLSAGKHKLEFIADFDKQKSETDENNNRLTLQFRAKKCSTGTGNPIKAPTPFKSQWNEKAQSGCANCGPASVAMTLAYYRKNISVDEAAIEIRGNACGGNTDFKGTKTKALLEKNGLKLVDVDSFDSMKAQLDLGRPVIILVHNDHYVRQASGQNSRLVPYYRKEGYSRHTDKNGKVSLVRHILVVTGYDNVNVYINDPLAVEETKSGVIADPQVGTNFAVPVETFKSAADEAGSAVGAAGWYSAAVTRK